MKKPALICIYTLLLAALGANHLSAQTFKFDGVKLLNQNHSFENGIAGWNDPQIPATVLDRDWQPGSASSQPPFYESFAEYGRKLIKLTNGGVFGQLMPVNPNNRKHMLNGFAFKEPAGSKFVAGYSAIGVTYYGLGGDFLDNFELEVGYPDSQFDRGIGDGLQFYSWGIEAPDGATSAYIYAYNSPNTVMYIDNLGLFEVTNPTSGSSVATNRIANNNFAVVGTENKGFNNNSGIYVGYGIEFWDSSIDWSRKDYISNNTFGSVNQNEWVTQVVPVKPGRTYSLLGLGYRTNAKVNFGFGIEFYDAKRQFISNRPSSAGTQENLNVGDRYVAPANAAFALIYLWVGKLSSSSDYAVFFPEFYEVDSRASNQTSVVVARGDSFVTKGGANTAISVLYTDSDGIDLNSIDLNDVKFTSKTSSVLYSPIAITNTIAAVNRKTVKVQYTLVGAPATDVRGLIVQPNQVKDSLGNFVPTKAFSEVFR